MINFENFDIYNFDFSKSNIKSNIDDLQSNNNLNENKHDFSINNLKNENIFIDKNKSKDITFYNNLEEYICENKLNDIINPKNLITREDNIKAIRSFEDTFQEIIEEKNKIIIDLKKCVLETKNELEEYKNLSSIKVVKLI